MAKPLHTPIQNPMTIKLMEPVEPTDANAPTPRYFPTIMVSTMLYSCWNKRPKTIGTKKPRISFGGDPKVISFTALFFIDFSLLYAFHGNCLPCFAGYRQNGETASFLIFSSAWRSVK